MDGLIGAGGKGMGRHAVPQMTAQRCLRARFVAPSQFSGICAEGRLCIIVTYLLTWPCGAELAAAETNVCGDVLAKSFHVTLSM